MKGFEMKGFEDLQKLGQQNMELTMKSVGELTKGWQTMAAEMGEYTKRSFEDGTQTFEKLSNARSFEQAVEIQSDFARRAYEEYMAQMSKIGNMYAEMAREAFKPVERVFNNGR
ncbi:MAG: phasin family protein [Hyphomicrobiaceae bacterium]